MRKRTIGILTTLCAATLLISCGPTQKVQRTLALNELSLQARTAASNGDDQRSLELWQEYVDRRPHSDFAEFQLGMTETRLGMYGQAIGHLTTAHDLRPGNIEYIEGLAEAYILGGRAEDMMTLMHETVREGEPGSGQLRLAGYAQRAGMYDEARQAIGSAMILIGEDSVEPYMAMADFARQVGNSELEEKSLRQALWFDRGSDKLDGRFLALGITPGPSLVIHPGLDSD